MKSIINLLSTTSAVTDLLADADSIFVNVSAQEQTIPFIVVDSEIEDTNASFTGENLDAMQVRVFCISDRTYTANGIAGAQDIADQVRSTLVGASGAYGTENYDVTMLENEETYVYKDPNITRFQVEQVYQVMRQR